MTPSQSTLTTCWDLAMILTFLVVWMFGSTMSPEQSTPAFVRRSLRCAPSASSPMAPTITGTAPSEARFMATLAAAPGMSLSEVTLTTGTGASGEMRFTSPRTK